MNRGVLVLALAGMFALGWWSARQWQAPAPTPVPTLSPAPQPAMPEPQPGDNDAAEFSRWLRTDAVGPALEVLQPLSPSDPRWQALQAQLRRLHAAGHWQRLLQWLDPLLHWDPRHQRWQDWRIEALLGEQRYRAALEALFQYHELTLSAGRRQQLMAKMETLITQQVDQRGGGNLSQDDALMNLLQLALEKQPDYAPFSLLLARVYELSGQWEQALYQLELLPFSPTHQAQVEAEKTRLAAQIRRRQQLAQGVGLRRTMGQFIVPVVFDDTVTLELMIDTGASITALKPEAIALLRRHTRLFTSPGQVRVNTANGEVLSPLYQVARMRVGDWELQAVDLLQVNLTAPEVDGLLGMNFLGQYAFSIDQQQSLLFLGEKPD
ncbi:MAG: retropepsin-like aspartic protease [Pseudomonadota bacterium]|nr:retropepsin-like aspartic protease [Pseudomonadota bacterium]